MNGLKLVAAVMMIAGVLGLAYGAFGYNSGTHSASVGGLEISVSEQHTVNVPVWAGLGAILAGAIVLAVDKKQKA